MTVFSLVASDLRSVRCRAKRGVRVREYPRNKHHMIRRVFVSRVFTHSRRPASGRPANAPIAGQRLFFACSAPQRSLREIVTRHD
jgi:hypothetical protein